MIFFTAIVAAAIPTLIYTLLIWWIDRYEKEPLALILVAFFWGAVPAIALALLLELALGAPLALLFGAPPGALPPPPLGGDASAVGLAPLVEEPLKAVALVGLFRWARHEFDGPLDGIVYGALIGFGFAMTENALYFVRFPANRDELVWVRAVVFGSNHALFSSVVGLALGYTRYRQGRALKLAALAGGLALAVLFHALHNFLTLKSDAMGLFFSWLVQSSGVLVIVAVAVLAWRHERAWMEQELGEEVAAGVISASDYAAVISPAGRLRDQWRSLLEAGLRRYLEVRRLHHLITELAFCKSKLKLADRFQSHAQHDRLRAEIAALRQRLGDRG